MTRAAVAALSLCLCCAACSTQIGGSAEVMSPDRAGGPRTPAQGEPVSFGPESDFKLPEPKKPGPLVLPTLTLPGVDVPLLTKLRVAQDQEALAADAEGAARAWDAVAGHVGSEATPNPFIELATARAAEWRASATTAAQRDKALAELKQAFENDKKELKKRIESEPNEARRVALRSSFDAAYMPYVEPIVAMGLNEPERPAPPLVAPKGPPPKTPILDPMGTPVVWAQTALVKADFGAVAQSFSVDTNEDLISVGGLGEKPSFDLSGFYAGGHAVVNVAQESELSIGLLAFGRYHVTTSLPDMTFVSGTDPSATIAPEDAGPSGAFVVGGGARIGGNITERLGMNFGLELGYLQFLPPASVPGCGPEQLEWDPTQRGVQGELFVGGEYYPLAVLSFGLSGRIGFGHVDGEWCVNADRISDDANTVDTPFDVSADSFSVGAQGEIGVHF